MVVFLFDAVWWLKCNINNNTKEQIINTGTLFNFQILPQNNDAFPPPSVGQWFVLIKAFLIVFIPSLPGAH